MLELRFFVVLDWASCFSEVTVMKCSWWVLQCLILSLSTTAWAAADSQNCEAKSQQIKGEARNQFLISCLARASSPENVKTVAAQKKRALCEQNSKNMRLEGGKKSGYINDCMNKDEAASVANRINTRAPALVQAKPAIRNNTVATGSHSTAPKKAVTKQNTAGNKQSCSSQAKQKGLKDEARKKFLRDCRKT